MHKISVHDAENQLRRLMDEVDQGEEVVITRGDGASFKLVPLSKGKAASHLWECGGGDPDERGL